MERGWCSQGMSLMDILNTLEDRIEQLQRENDDLKERLKNVGKTVEQVRFKVEEDK